MVVVERGKALWHYGSQDLVLGHYGTQDSVLGHYGTHDLVSTMALRHITTVPLWAVDDME